MPPALKKAARTLSTYTDPYPSDCQPIPQPDLQPDEELAYVAESWWNIGLWEFQQLDLGGGAVKNEPAAVWDYDRAASAFVHALQFKKRTINEVALYNYAWDLFKQQRYEAATKTFVQLLFFTDLVQKETGATTALDLLPQLMAYSVHRRLAHERRLRRPRAQRAVHPAAGHRRRSRPREGGVEAPRRDRPPPRPVAIVPQDKPWTINIYRSLAEDFVGAQPDTTTRSKSVLGHAEEVADGFPDCAHGHAER